MNGDRDLTGEQGSVAPAARLVVVCGLPGSGKSTLASRLAASLEARWISSDAVRSELRLQGRYDMETIAAVYGEMMSRAEADLGAGRSVVLDGSFSSRRFRAQAQRLAVAADAPFIMIRMIANEETTLRRVQRKRALTEAGPEAYRLLKKHFDPIEGPHLTLDSSKARLGALLRAAQDYALGRKRRPTAAR